MTAKVAIHWNSRDQETHSACLEDGRLRVEQVSGLDLETALPSIIEPLGLRAGFEAVFSATPIHRVEDFAQVESVCRFMGASQTHRCLCVGAPPLTPEIWLPLDFARRRPTRRFGCISVSMNGGTVVGVDPRGPRVQLPSSHDLKRIRSECPLPVDRLAALISALRAAHPVQPPDYWVAMDGYKDDLLTTVADRTGIPSIAIPAHSGAACVVGLLVRDDYASFEERLARPISAAHQDIPALRVAFLRLMDQATEHALRAGFDTDDLVCTKWVSVALPEPGAAYLIKVERTDSFNAIVAEFESFAARHEIAVPTESALVIVGVMIDAMIDLPKPRLPAVAESSTIVGAGRPAQTVVDGPGVMRACLTEITVPAGWRATWEESGDVVLARQA